MKIYTNIKIDLESGQTIYEESYEYYGPLSLCCGDGGDGGDGDNDGGNTNDDPDRGGRDPNRDSDDSGVNEGTTGQAGGSDGIGGNETGGGFDSSLGISDQDEEQGTTVTDSWGNEHDFSGGIDTGPVDTTETSVTDSWGNEHDFSGGIDMDEVEHDLNDMGFDTSPWRTNEQPKTRAEIKSKARQNTVEQSPYEKVSTRLSNQTFDFSGKATKDSKGLGPGGITEVEARLDRGGLPGWNGTLGRVENFVTRNQYAPALQKMKDLTLDMARGFVTGGLPGAIVGGFTGPLSRGYAMDYGPYGPLSEDDRISDEPTENDGGPDDEPIKKKIEPKEDPKEKAAALPDDEETPDDEEKHDTGNDNKGTVKEEPPTEQPPDVYDLPVFNEPTKSESTGKVPTPTYEDVLELINPKNQRRGVGYNQMRRVRGKIKTKIKRPTLKKKKE